MFRFWKLVIHIYMKKHHPNSYNSKFHRNRSNRFDLTSVYVRGRQKTQFLGAKSETAFDEIRDLARFRHIIRDKPLTSACSGTIDRQNGPLSRHCFRRVLNTAWESAVVWFTTDLNLLDKWSELWLFHFESIRNCHLCTWKLSLFT